MKYTTKRWRLFESLLHASVPLAFLIAIAIGASIGMSADQLGLAATCGVIGITIGKILSVVIWRE